MNLGRAFRALVVAEPLEPCVQAPLAVDLLAAYLPAGIRAHHALAAVTTALIALTFLSGIIIMFKSRTIAALQREVRSLKIIAKTGSAPSASEASLLQRPEQVETRKAVERVAAPNFTVGTATQQYAARPERSSNATVGSSKQLHVADAIAAAVSSEEVTDVTAAYTARNSVALAVPPKLAPAAHVPAAHKADDVREEVLQACGQSNVTAAPTVLNVAATTSAPLIAPVTSRISSSYSSNAALEQSASTNADSAPLAAASAPATAAATAATAPTAAEPSSRVLQQQSLALACCSSARRAWPASRILQ
jgi:hypothetical protein